MKELIMVTGYKRAGKDTFGDYLVDNYNYIKAQPFACFKKPLQDWFGFDDEQMNGNLKEVVDTRWGISPRELMQIFGTDLMKDCLGDLCPTYYETTGHNIWAKVFRNWYLSQPDGKYVVCDWRFPEEYEFVADLPDITTVRILNDRVDKNDTHISESYIEELPCQYAILNYDSMQEYYDNIDMTMPLISCKKHLTVC